MARVGFKAPPELSNGVNPEEPLSFAGREGLHGFLQVAMERGPKPPVAGLGQGPEVQHRDPDLPVIVLSRTAGEHEWVAVLEAGAFDLLVPPYRQQALLAVLEQASASRWRLRNLGTVSKKKAV